LDTEVFRRYGHNLNDKVLQTFLKQIKDHICTSHTTDITLSEIRRQIEEMSAEVAQAVNKGNKELRRWLAARTWKSTVTNANPDVDAAGLAKDALLQFNFGIRMDWKPIEHMATNVPAKDVFDAYFRRDPPFDRVDSKEFPDAFVVMALDRWCKNKSEKMYVITKDRAMLRAVEKTDTLIPVGTLDEFLEIIVEAQHPTILNKVQNIFDSAAWNKIDERVRDQIGQLGTVYTGSLHDGEVIDHEPGDAIIELIDFNVISASEDQIEVVAKVRVPVKFDVQYLDTDSAWWDSEEKEFIGGDSEVATYDAEVVISLLVIIDANDEIIDVDILTRDLRLEEPYEDYK